MIGHDLKPGHDGDYSCCRTPADVLRVLEKLPHRRSVSWNDAIALVGKDLSALHAHSRLVVEAQSKNRIAEVFRALQAIEQRSNA